MKLLVLSNGHGEDVIAVRILKQLQSNNKKLELAALPIVGEGYSYTKIHVPIIGRVQQMPSGGFIYMEGDRLWQDVRGGLIKLTLEQINLVRQWGQSGGAILAVGDIVPLLYAWFSGANYAFIGTAKSEYYLRDENGWLSETPKWRRYIGSKYFPWELWLANRDRCKAVFPRDGLTATILQQKSLRVYDLGNPMMDDLVPKTPYSTRSKIDNLLSILLLPGSRMPEALNNWEKIMAAVAGVMEFFAERQLQFLAAIAPSLNLFAFEEYLVDRNWNLVDFPTHIPVSDERARCFVKGRATLWLTRNHNNESLQQTDIAIAMAGTATEQYVGLGKPVVTIAGTGPQFTPTFARAQTRLLGCSVTLVENPERVANAIASTIANPQKLTKIAHNGRRRMGDAGAAQRIASCLQNTLLKNELDI